MVHFSFYSKQGGIDSEEVAKKFCNIYYDNMINVGFNGNVNLFEYDAKCDYNDHTYVGARSLLGLYNSESISKFKYNDLECVSSEIDRHTLLIHVTGYVQACVGGCCGKNYYDGCVHSDLYKFSEVFVLKMNSGGNFCVSNYIFRMF